MTPVIATSQRAQQRPLLASKRIFSILFALLGLSTFCGANGATLVVAPGAAAVADDGKESAPKPIADPWLDGYLLRQAA
jgi:hypothetical protein